MVHTRAAARARYHEIRYKNSNLYFPREPRKSCLSRARPVCKPVMFVARRPLEIFVICWRFCTGRVDIHMMVRPWHISQRTIGAYVECACYMCLSTCTVLVLTQLIPQMAICIARRWAWCHDSISHVPAPVLEMVHVAPRVMYKEPDLPTHISFGVSRRPQMDLDGSPPSTHRQRYTILQM